MSRAIAPSVRDQAVQQAATAHRVRPADVLSASRYRAAAHARQDAMASLRAILGPDGEPRYSLPAIGRAFDRDHTTALHAIRRSNARQEVSQ